MGKMIKIVSALGKAASAVPEPIKSAVVDEVKKTAEQLAPSPEQIAQGISAAGEKLRQKAPDAMQKAQGAAEGVISAAKKYTPKVMERAEKIADDVRSHHSDS